MQHLTILIIKLCLVLINSEFRRFFRIKFNLANILISLQGCLMKLYLHFLSGEA